MKEQEGEMLPYEEREELDRKKEYLAWLDFAQRDLDTAKYLNDGTLYPKPIEIICYHCQQAVEKAVKALVVYFGSPGGIPKVHDIAFLLNQIKHVLKSEMDVEINDELLEKAESLTKYGIAPRYPNEIEITEQMTAAALRDAAELFGWVKALMP